MGFADPPPDALNQNTIEEVLRRRYCRAADGAFEYWFTKTDDRPDSAFVLMQIFGGLLAVGFVLDGPLPEVPVPAWLGCGTIPWGDGQ
jgi:hypothetical protein